MYTSYFFKSCILDILRNLPRSTFSDKQNNIISWGLKILGVRQVPSDLHMKHIANKMQLLYGVDSIWYQGALGHIYYLNDISQIIAQVCMKRFTVCFNLNALCRKWPIQKCGLCYNFTQRMQENT